MQRKFLLLEYESHVRSLWLDDRWEGTKRLAIAKVAIQPLRLGHPMQLLPMKHWERDRLEQ
jgi:hypothetical protein